MPYKHVDEVIAAFRQLPSDQLVIVGTGPCEAELREQSGSNVVFQGTVDDATLRWLYSNSRALVSASQEDFGLTSLEAAAFGRPAAVLRWGGFLDNVVEGRTGLFFDNPERDEIRDCIRRLLKQSWDTEFIIRHAGRFSEASFSARLRDVVTEELLRA
jgi:glycosyltransferase involved in cell wall biosynthesis